MVAVRVVVSLLCLFLTLLKNYYDGGRETEDNFGEMGWLKVKRGADMSRELCLPSLFDVFMSKTSFLPGGQSAVGNSKTTTTVKPLLHLFNSPTPSQCPLTLMRLTSERV